MKHYASGGVVETRLIVKPVAGTVKLYRDGVEATSGGWFGEVILSEQGIFRTELRLIQALAQRIGELYGPECRADLDDHPCRVPIEPPLVVRGAAYAEGVAFRVATLAGANRNMPCRPHPSLHPGRSHRRSVNPRRHRARGGEPHHLMFGVEYPEVLFGPD